MGVKGSSWTKDAHKKKTLFIECFTHRFSNSHKFQIMKDVFLIIPFSFCLSREHFPFFLTAPDGWKNTIRHNLCFSNSFKKTPQQVSGDGKRKSCLWHLTLDGRQRLRDETNMLTGDSFRMLKRSMNYPGQDLELREWWGQRQNEFELISFSMKTCVHVTDMIQALLELWSNFDPMTSSGWTTGAAVIWFLYELVNVSTFCCYYYYCVTSFCVSVFVFLWHIVPYKIKKCINVLL